MDKQDFLHSLQHSSPPAGTTVYLQALWYDAKGDWEKAHELIQDLPDQKAALLHAYLHRKEGDQWNAEYWYRKAGRNPVNGSLSDEFDAMLNELLE
jgi:hypothetical protein